MHDASLTSLAILKVHWDKGHDYIDNFVPFVGEAVRRAPDDVVSVVQIQATIRDEFGLVIPQGALNTLLRRAERHGIVRREHGVFLRDKPAIEPSFEQVRSDVSRQHAALVEKFLDFCKAKHNVILSQDEADNALLGHLQHSCIPLLAAAVDGCAIPQPDKVQHGEFLVSAFTIHLNEKDPVGFRFLETVMKGSMLATALFLPEIAQVNRKFSKLTVYLDTQLLLRGLGFEGQSLGDATTELLKLLYDLNVDLACFESTRDEVYRVLEAAQHALGNPRNGIKGSFAVYEHFVSSGAQPSDVALTIANLDKLLRRLRVAVRSRPPYTSELGLNELRLAELIREAMPFQREDPHRHDVDAITAIHRLRAGALKFSVETCGHLFVTSNNSLAAAAARFMRTEFGADYVPLSVNDHTMATLAWIKNPTFVADFSRDRLIAESYAALRPNNDLLRKYMEEIARLQRGGELSDTDADLLRFSTAAKGALVDLTLGNPDVFTQGTVREVLEVARANARRDAEIALAAEVARRYAAEEREKSTVELAQQARERQDRRVEQISRRVGEIVGNLVTGGVFGVLLIGGIQTLPTSVPKLGSEWAQLVVFVGVIFFAAASIYSLLEAGFVRQWKRSVESFVAGKVKLALLRIIALLT